MTTEWTDGMVYGMRSFPSRRISVRFSLPYTIP